MVYPDNFEQRIGYDVIREQCAAKCTTSGSRDLFLSERFSVSEREIQRRQTRTDEMRRILSCETGVPSFEIFELQQIIDKARVEGTHLDVEEVINLGSTVGSVCALGDFIMSRPENAYPSLRSLTRVVRFTPQIPAEIDRIIDRHGEIRDTASERLASIRRDIRAHEGQASKRLQAVLQAAKTSGIVDDDATVSIRDGRAVIPVPALNKRKLNGFIQDESSTGKTFYIEPVEVVELNNALKELLYEERREIIAILTSFTHSVRGAADDLDTENMFASMVDVLRAKALWAIENGAEKPSTADASKGLYLRLEKAFHPILKQTLAQTDRKAVPMSAELDPKSRIMVVSGPNAGGKSVCLKTFGLLQYMYQCGMPVTASPTSEFPVFSKIFIDIGDEQSIENDLSTYSSHLRNMREMLRGADDRTMILIDEFGSGTEPVMGASIAEAVLEKLVEMGCYGVITTHYSNIKYYAASHPGVVNASMSFDVQNIRPLFELEVGKPGSSFAVEMARKTGLPESIIEAAKQKAGRDHVDMEKQLREIARDRHYWAEKRERIRQADRHVEELETKYTEQLARIREERKEILHSAKEQAREIMSEANRRIESTIKDIRESQAEKELTRQARKELEEFRQEVEAPSDDLSDERIAREMERLERRQKRRQERREKDGREPQTEAVRETPKPKQRIEVGTKVRLSGQNGVGSVMEIRGKKAKIAFGQIMTTVDMSSLETVSQAEYRAQTRPVTPRTVIGSEITERRASFRTSIDIRGKRVAEALDEIRNYVDDALMIGISSVTILHGKGTGALKEEIRKYLRSVPEVRSAVDDHPDRGGSGITVVTFDI